jgi:hypothetical protein
MFTVKYRTYNPCPKQPADCTSRQYDEVEMIQGPFAFVSKEMEDGYTVVYAHRDDTAPGYTFGPIFSDEAGRPRPALWVMNEQGATIAKYDL